MKSLGIVRRIDCLGRVTLPKELRDIKGLPEGTQMEVFVEGDMIVLKKYHPGCIFCGSIDDSFDADTFKGKDICGKCKEDLRR